ncbi:hypothetical protein HMPREF3220_04571 [Citrobacter koseri]|nr:hypothetical protein HMPREF3220_04571 [Citrobacter koseri]
MVFSAFCASEAGAKGHRRLLLCTPGRGRFFNFAGVRYSG